MELADDALAAWIEEVRRTPPAPLDVAALRRPRERPRGPELDRVEDLLAPGDPPVPVRLYRPGPQPLPLVVFVHGGGFVFGDLESHDRACRRLARLAGAAVLAVDVPPRARASRARGDRGRRRGGGPAPGRARPR